MTSVNRIVMNFKELRLTEDGRLQAFFLLRSQLESRFRSKLVDDINAGNVGLTYKWSMSSDGNRIKIVHDDFIFDIWLVAEDIVIYQFDYDAAG